MKRKGESSPRSSWIAEHHIRRPTPIPAASRPRAAEKSQISILTVAPPHGFPESITGSQMGPEAPLSTKLEPSRTSLPGREFMEKEPWRAATLRCTCRSTAVIFRPPSPPWGGGAPQPGTLFQLLRCTSKVSSMATTTCCIKRSLNFEFFFYF